MKNPLSSIVSLEELSLSELMVAHLRKELSRSQLLEAQKLMKEKVDQGEEDMRLLFRRLQTILIGNREPVIVPITNYYDYFKFIYSYADTKYQSTKIMAGLSPEEMGYRDLYRKIAKNVPDPLVEQLKRMPLYLEVAYYPNSPLVTFMVVRRKDHTRAVNKLTKRIIEDIIYGETIVRNPTKLSKYKPEPLLIRDMFGLKVVTNDPEQVDEVIPKIYDPRKERLLGHRHSEERELKYDKNKELMKDEYGHPLEPQPPGIDDQRKYGPSKAMLVQMGFFPLHQDHTDLDLREIIVTDLEDMIYRAEPGHLRFRMSQDRRLEEIRKERKLYRPIVRDMLSRGDELVDLLSEGRRRVLLPTQLFPENPYTISYT